MTTPSIGDYVHVPVKRCYARDDGGKPAGHSGTVLKVSDGGIYVLVRFNNWDGGHGPNNDLWWCSPRDLDVLLQHCVAVQDGFYRDTAPGCTMPLKEPQMSALYEVFIVDQESVLAPKNPKLVIAASADEAKVKSGILASLDITRGLRNITIITRVVDAIPTKGATPDEAKF